MPSSAASGVVSLEPRVVRTNKKTHALTLTVSAAAALAAAAAASTSGGGGGGGEGDAEDEADGGRTYVFASADAAEMRRWHHSIQVMEIRPRFTGFDVGPHYLCAALSTNHKFRTR